MVTFVYGVAGTLAVLAMLAGGFGIGWKAHAAFIRHTRTTAPPIEDRELKRLQEGQEAFRIMQNYNADRAYGLLDGPSEGEEGSDG